MRKHSISYTYQRGYFLKNKKKWTKSLHLGSIQHLSRDKELNRNKKIAVEQKIGMLLIHQRMSIVNSESILNKNDLHINVICICNLPPTKNS